MAGGKKGPIDMLQCRYSDRTQTFRDVQSISPRVLYQKLIPVSEIQS